MVGVGEGVVGEEDSGAGERVGGGAQVVSTGCAGRGSGEEEEVFGHRLVHSVSRRRNLYLYVEWERAESTSEPRIWRRALVT